MMACAPSTLKVVAGLRCAVVVKYHRWRAMPDLAIKPNVDQLLSA